MTLSLPDLLLLVGRDVLDPLLDDVRLLELPDERGSHSSEAMPRSLQHRISAFDLQPSAAVDTPSSLKYCCSPRAWATNLIARGG
ncbi:hypothetical protein NUW58_g10899 [Xylaria curta]|uniref:Uncharacterized protein n=1 Tax=Xylaria curta TaxID=42375 RepID=A0ACC1MEK8_9PEZI|nr:hypothetical protein NUW58_g10899 [Xylaria curta]